MNNYNLWTTIFRNYFFSKFLALKNCETFSNSKLIAHWSCCLRLTHLNVHSRTTKAATETNSLGYNVAALTRGLIGGNNMEWLNIQHLVGPGTVQVGTTLKQID